MTLPLFAPGQVDDADDTGNRDTWRTPDLLAKNLVELFSLRLDVAASQANTKCARFYTAADDGLSQPWDDNVWCNPPYSDCSPWVDKAIRSMNENHHEWRAVLLLPAMVGVSWFTRATMASSWYTFNRRIQFVPPPGVKASSSNIGNVLCVFDGTKPHRHIGKWCGVLDSITGEPL